MKADLLGLRTSGQSRFAGIGDAAKICDTE
jgi:hypothetical protein